MRRGTLALVAIFCVWHVFATGVEPRAVTSQGVVAAGAAGTVRTSPLGTARMEIEFAAGAHGGLEGSIVATTVDGRVSRLSGVPGSAFLISDVGRIVAIETPDTHALPSTIRILHLDGLEIASRQVRALSNPALSPDGERLAYGTSTSVVVLDLRTMKETAYPRFDVFALGPRGRVAGASANPREPAAGSPSAWELLIFDGAATPRRVRLDARPSRVAFSGGGSSVLLLDRHALTRIDVASGRPEVLFEAPAGARLRDLSVERDLILVGFRSFDRGRFLGGLATIAPDGRLLRLERGPSRRIPRAPSGRLTSRGIPWPIAPDSQHPIGNTYGEYQNYGGGGYLHPGVDVMGSPGQPAYAVRSGIVKAVFTTSAEFHWRVAVADSATAGASEGYLYAHLDESSIAVDVGDTVGFGQYLGDLVEWPIYDFTHVHFARIEDDGLQWYGDWLTTENPHLDFDNQSDLTVPVFEPARGSDLLAFCLNQTSVYQDPAALTGLVDIIAHVGDTIESSWVCTVQEIRYTIYPLGYPEFPVVDDKLALFCDMVLDTYFGGPIDPFLVGLLYKRDGTCFTRGDYDYREFFHVITNSNGDQVYEESDLWEAWDTTAVPDADYVVRVIARDATGNATADSMTVTTMNGNPTWAPPASGSDLTLSPCFPNPTAAGTAIALTLPAPDRLRVSVYDAGGRLVRRLADAPFGAGPLVLRWSGVDSRGAEVASGTYFVRVESSEEDRRAKLVVVR